MDKLDFYDLVQQAREEQQKVICFIRPESSAIYRLNFIRDILDPEVNLNEYKFKESKGIEYLTLDLVNDKEVDGIESASLQELATSSIVDYDINTKNIKDRFKMYMGYFSKFATTRNVWDFLYLYFRSLETQRQIAKQLNVSMSFLYDRTSVNEIRELEKRQYLLKIGSMKFNYMGMIYINIYTFDIYLQLYHHPHIDILLAGITSPINGNLLIGILPADSSEQVISQYVGFKSDITKIITTH